MLTVQTLVNDFKLEVVSGEVGLSREIPQSQLSRPGIELAGLFDFYEHDRIQLLGSKEITFFWWLNEQDQEIRVNMLFEQMPPAFIFSTHVEIPEVFIRKGHDFGVPILKSEQRTSALASRLYQYLFAKLAPRKSLHGTLLDISGVGVLIRGESGIGKSEVALELVRRGHQLVADDRVDVYQKEEGLVIGEAPDLLKNYLEIRGIGLVNVVKLFGASAYKEDKTVMLIVELVHWDEHFDYDRLGIEDTTEKIFDTEIPYAKIPITAARSVSTLVEVAAMNARLKFMGTHMARDFMEALSTEIDKKNKSKKE
ncbi:HPr(Ser) kinase/phosphatase [Liberiplasma polymorphum]|uniref:HPr(Ser) kinase/phosphatase n=1 Tax=Liberiplasma polymorphum TaxID=3374570 RepID=UPI003774A806